MKFLLKYLIIICCCVNNLLAQPNDNYIATSTEYYDVALNHIKLANYSNAISALQKAIDLSPENIFYKQELGRVYLLNKQVKQADEILSKVIKEDVADEKSFKYACEAKAGLDKFDEAIQTLEKGLKKFPNSGILYYTKGNLYDFYKEFQQAINAYEMGIEVAPDYPNNYYNAAKLQLRNPNNFIASILYAESYIALDPFTQRTDEMKVVLFNGYTRICTLLRADKDVFAQNNALQQSKNFEKKIIEIFEHNKKYIIKDNYAVNLNLFRTKFLLEWFRIQSNPMQIALFKRLHQYIIEGFFPLYNTWLFGPFGNAHVFEEWNKTNESKIKDMYHYFNTNAYNPILKKRK